MRRERKLRPVKNEKKQKNLKESVIESLQLPKDLMLGMPITTVTGFHEVSIENYRGILEYTEELLILQTKTCQITLTGKQMNIDYYTNDEMKICGIIHQIQYTNYTE